MLATCEDVLPQRQELWPRFERLVGLRGRKMYAVADLVDSGQPKIPVGGHFISLSADS